LNSNQLAELLAIPWVINEEPPHNDLTIKMKLSYSRNTIFDGTKTWEPMGYIRIRNREILPVIVASLRN
jgi:hypothetical protein